MNTIYRIVWNRSRQAWEVASELARRGHGGADSVAVRTAGGGRLRRLPLALGYMLGGWLMVAAMPVHAADTDAAQMHQRMRKVDTRLADLSDLMVKYDDGAAPPRATSAPERQPAAATPPAPRPNATAVVSSVAKVSSDSPASSDTAPPSSAPADRSGRVKHAVAASHTASRTDVRSPHLASDAQIAAVLAARDGRSAAASDSTARSGSVWVVGSDGALRVTNTADSRPAASAPRVAAAAAPAQHASGVMAPRDANVSTDGEATVAVAADSPSLPDVDIERTATIRMPSAGALATVSTNVPASVPDTARRGVDAAGLPSAPEPVPAPLPPRPDPVMKQSLVADVAHPAGDAAVASQTSSLVLDVNPSDVNLAVAGMDRARGSLEPAADLADTGTATAGDSGRIVAAAVDEPVPYRFSSGDAQGMTFSSSAMRGSAMAVTPMALQPGDPRRPRPIETPAPGLIVSNNGLVGGALGLLGNSTDSLFNGGGSEHYVSAGSLRVSNANFSQAYGVTSVLGIPLVNLTPVGSVLEDVDGDLVGGTGSNSHLTLIGGVTSGNYIRNINNGAAGGLLGLLLPDEAPDWASECMNVLGLVKTECWGVNAAQDYQVLVGDGASANGSKEVVIGTNASHTLAEVDADEAFPGDGRNDETNPSGVPTSDYAARLGHSVVIGDDASGNKNGQTILGAEATSDKANSVALGYQSEAVRGGDPDYDNAYGLQGLSQASAGEVAVGRAGSERQITHVAAGTEDHDAVNVMQLKGAVSGAVAGAVLYDVDAGGDPLNHVTLTGDGTGAPVGIGNLAAGEVSATSTDAVNGAQLAASNTAIVDYFGGTTAYDPTTNTFTGPTFSITDVDSDGNTTSNDYDNVTDAFAAVDSSVTTVNDRVTNIYETGVKYFHANSTGADSDAGGTDAIAVGPAATAGGTDAIAIGNGADAGMDGSIALGAGSVTSVGAQTDYTAYGLSAPQTSAGEVNVGNRQITGVAAGDADDDAVNVAQLKGVADVASRAVQYDGVDKAQVTLAGPTSGDGGLTDGTVITNLRQGEVSATSTDAVNGAQLAASNTAIVDYFGGTTAYDPTTNTFTGPTFSITDVDSDGNTTSNDYDNVTDAFAAVDSSVTTVNDRVTNIYETGVKYFHANSTGADSDAGGTDAIAVGPAATAGGTDAIAIGNGADAGMDGSIALGAGSVTSVGAQTDYTAYGLSAPQTSAGEVNVGNRQITGVAAGDADDDAVNVAQLKGVADVASRAVQYDGVDKTQVTLAGPTSGDGGLTDGTVITNLHQGQVVAGSTDAVNGSQLFDTNRTVASYFGGVTGYDGSTNTWAPPNFTITQIDTDGTATSGDYDNVTDAFAAVDGSLTNINQRITDATGDLKYFHANSSGADADAAGDRSVAMGGDAVAQGNGSVAAGDGAQATTDGAVAIGQQASADGGQAVAIGNGAQASGDGAVSIGDPNVVAGDGAVGLGKDNQATGDGAIALGQDNQAVGEGAVAFGNAAQASADGALALGNEANASVAGGIALGAGSVADRTGTGQEAFTGVAVPGTGAVSVGADGQERQITHVAGGTEDTDAVNLRQLREVDSRIGSLGDLAVLYDDAGKTRVTFNNGGSAVLLTNVAGGDISATSLDAINGSQLYFWTQDTGNSYSNYSLYQQIQNLTNSDEFAVNNTDNLPKADAQGDNSAAGGAGTVAAGSDSTALGNGAQAEGDNSVALGAGSVATRDNAVSVGSKGHERQVTHVAAGSEDTDAVNVAQLKQSTAGTVQYDKSKDGSVDYGSITLGAPDGRSAPTVVRNVGDGKADTDAVNVRQLHAGVQEAENWAKNYTDEQIGGLSRQLNNVGNKAYAGVASAMAMAGLPQAYLPGKNMVSIAGSSFHGESSVAVGVSMISEGGKWVYKLNGTDNSRGDAGVSVGVGFQW